jgi:FMN phosphatase YigB (HAD superfamily)
MPKILLFDLYGTLLEDASLDFNLDAVAYCG